MQCKAGDRVSCMHESFIGGVIAAVFAMRSSAGAGSGGEAGGAAGRVCGIHQGKGEGV